MKRIALLILMSLTITGCTSEAEQEKILVDIYYVGDTPRGFKLFSEKINFTAQEELAEKVISDLISGALQPLDPDYINLWDASNSLNELTLSGTKAVVDLKLGKLNVGSEGEQRAIDQIVWTLTGINTSIRTVSFLVNGKTTESFAGHVDTTVDFRRTPDYEVLNPVQISSVQEGQTLGNPVAISGEACTFEANVVWTLYKDGDVFADSFTTAEIACPDRSGWRVNLNELEPGNYRFEVKEYSAEDGSLFAIDDKSFIVN